MSGIRPFWNEILKVWDSTLGKPVELGSTNGSAHVALKSSDIVHPAENVHYVEVTLDGTTTDSYVIQNTANYSICSMKITGIGGSEVVSVQGDTSSDQSGVYTPKLVFSTQSAHIDAGTSATDFTNNNWYIRHMMNFSALKVYISTADGVSGGTVVVYVTLKGAGA